MKFALAALIGFASVSASAAPKSYAVFMATYDAAKKMAIGGVAGSAFFVSPTQAITAFHVLQPGSFKDSHTQIWLVHEGEPAIELRLSDLASDPANDKTTITTREKARYTFTVGKSAPGDRVETDGFLASSSGPVLEIAGDRLRIVGVPRLERLHAEGSVLRAAAVELNSSDVNLKHTPCLQVSYKPIVGLSGGPVFTGDRVVGMNSFADPEARASTWAVTLD